MKAVCGAVVPLAVSLVLVGCAGGGPRGGSYEVTTLAQAPGEVVRRAIAETIRENELMVLEQETTKLDGWVRVQSALSPLLTIRYQQVNENTTRLAVMSSPGDRSPLATNLAGEVAARARRLAEEAEDEGEERPGGEAGREPPEPADPAERTNEAEEAGDAAGGSRG